MARSQLIFAARFFRVDVILMRVRHDGRTTEIGIYRIRDSGNVFRSTCVDIDLGFSPRWGRAIALRRESRVPKHHMER